MSRMKRAVACTDEGEDDQWQRVQVYLSYCASFKATPNDGALALFRHASVSKFVAPPDFSLKDLLPLAECLAWDNVVTALDFSGVTKPLGDLAAHALSYLLSRNETIEHLNLSHQGLGPEGITMVCRALEKSQSLVTIRLRGNNAGREGASAIARLIRKNLHRLRYIDVSNNALSVEGVHIITAALKARAAEILRLQELYPSTSGAETEQRPTRAEQDGVLMGRSRTGSTSTNAAAEPPSSERRATGSRPSSRRGSRSSSLGSVAEGIDLATQFQKAAATQSIPDAAGWLWGGLSDLKLSTDLIVRASWEPLRPSEPSSSSSSSASASSLVGGAALRVGTVLPSATLASALEPSPASLASNDAAPASTSREGDLEPVAEEEEAVKGVPTDTATAADGNAAGSSDGSSSSSAESSQTTKKKAMTAASRSSRHKEAARLTARIPELQIRISGNFVREELYSAALFGAAFILALFGSLPVLLRKAHLAEDPRLTLGLVLYSSGLLAFFGSSTLRHSLFLTDAAAVFRLIDHSAIFFLIGATYSPFLLTNLHRLQPVYANALFVAVWALVVFGAAVSSLRIPLPRTVWKLFLKANRLLVLFGFSKATASSKAAKAAAASAAVASGKDAVPTKEAYAEAAAALLEDTLDPPLYRSVRLWIYFLGGWLGVLPFLTTYRCLPGEAWSLLGGGGLLFSLGIFSYKGNSRLSPNRLHTSYYLLVLVASFLHWVAVFLYSGTSKPQ
jgi:channel protein (hemolysin III family)